MDETSKAIEMRSTKLTPENYYANWPFKVRKVGLGGEDEGGSRYQTFNHTNTPISLYSWFNTIT